MASTPTRIILKHSLESGTVPDIETLFYGELALNVADHKLFYRARNSNNILDDTLKEVEIDPIPTVQSFLDSLDDPLYISAIEVNEDNDLVVSYVNAPDENLGNVTGATGATGAGFIIQGAVDYADQLPRRTTSPPLNELLQVNGTIYAVTKGSALNCNDYDKTHIFVYDFGHPEYETSDTWTNLGEVAGMPGIQGEGGDVGPKGEKGDTGVRGEPGPMGLPGLIGPRGATGIVGPLGPVGPIGPKGPKGPTGPRGYRGEIGTAGPTGLTGSTGLTGATGNVGPAYSLIIQGHVEYQDQLPTAANNDLPEELQIKGTLYSVTLGPDSSQPTVNLYADRDPAETSHVFWYDGVDTDIWIDIGQLGESFYELQYWSNTGDAFSSRLTPRSGTNINAIIEPKGTGAFILSQPTYNLEDQHYAGGFPRGNYATDLQRWRGETTTGILADATAIAGGRRSFIGAGSINKIEAGLESSSESSAILAGGLNHIENSDYSSIIIGQHNYINSGENSAIVSGQYNQIVATGIDSFIAGGKFNIIDTQGDNNAILGGQNNSITQNNLTSANRGRNSSSILGGDRNVINGGQCCIVSGFKAESGYEDDTPHDGVFVFSDYQLTAEPFTSLTSNSFNIRAEGGLRLVDGNETAGYVLTCDENGVGHWAESTGGIGEGELIPGPKGATGPEGPQGETGDTGVRGLDGPTGPQGLDGLDGQPGPAGATGVVYDVYVHTTAEPPTTYIAGTNDETVLIVDAAASSSDITINLPAAGDSVNKGFHIKKVDSTANKIIIDANATGSYIDGQANIEIKTQYETITIVCDGAFWWKISQTIEILQSTGIDAGLITP